MKGKKLKFDDLRLKMRVFYNDRVTGTVVDCAGHVYGLKIKINWDDGGANEYTYKTFPDGFYEWKETSFVEDFGRSSDDEDEEDKDVNHPSHYNVGGKNGIETIDYLESLGTAEDFCSGNAIKYLSRYKHKDSEMKDVRKALWYVKRLIKILKKQKGGVK